jgi:malonate transporter
MLQILGLILPLFGLIVIGFVAARITRQPVEALGWLNTFIVYVALPALFIKLLSRTPVEQLANFGFIGADVIATYAISC